MHPVSAPPSPRFNMVEQQVRPWEVLDDLVLNQMLALPRERFVPEDYRGLAHADTAIPLGHGHRMLEPRLVGRLVQALELAPGDRALEIGSGSGYVTALMARLADQVISYELHPDIAARARANLAAAGVDNATIREGDGLNSEIPESPFDAILVTGSCPDYPEHLEAMLRPGGRLVVVTGSGTPMTAWRAIRESDSACARESLFETWITPMENTRAASTFAF